MADIIPANVIVKANGQPFDNTGQILAIPTQERSYANIYLVQDGSDIVRYFFKNGLTDGDLEVWNTSGGGDYVEYNAVVSQNTTNDPVATVKNNDLSGTPVFTRDGAGEFSISLTGGFPTSARTQIFHNQPNSAGYIRVFWVNANAISITQVSLDGSETLTDTFAGLALTIRVWNS
jgi:hypothetical protein